MKTTPTRLVSPLSAGGSPAFAALRVSCTRLLTVLLLIGFGAFIGLIDRAAAQGVVPERFSFQGYMEDGNGQPLGPTTPVNYNVIFKIFPAATGGAFVWAERQIVTFDKGNYSVILGQGAQNGGEPHGDLSAVPINATSSELYVETIVNINGSDTTIKPRLRLLPTMYAFLAKKALSADQALSVNGSAILPGSITVDRLSTTLSNSLLTAPIPDTRLTANVALRSGSNNFGGNQTINGNVGVGINAGTGRLLVNGGVRARGGAPGLAGVNDNGYAFTGNGGDTDSGMFSSADGQLELYTQNAERMRINAAGNVGIGVANPTNRLDVNGTISATNIVITGATTNYSLVAGHSPVRMVAGKLPKDPVLNATSSGPGWHALGMANKTWRVFFDPAFATAPTVVCTYILPASAPWAGGATLGTPIVAMNAGDFFNIYAGVSATDINNFSSVCEVSFIAIGAR